MFLEAEGTLRPADQTVLFYLYTPDLPGLRDHLLANGVEVSAIRYPDYMRSGGVRLDDPDGYVILVGHWGKEEHEEWERRLEGKKRAEARR